VLQLALFPVRFLWKKKTVLQCDTSCVAFFDVTKIWLYVILRTGIRRGGRVRWHHCSRPSRITGSLPTEPTLHDLHPLFLFESENLNSEVHPDGSSNFGFFSLYLRNLQSRWLPGCELPYAGEDFTTFAGCRACGESYENCLNLNGVFTVSHHPVICARAKRIRNGVISYAECERAFCWHAAPFRLRNAVS
jgi:hypothetical protein